VSAEQDALSQTLAMQATLAPHAAGMAAAPRSTILPAADSADTAGRSALAALAQTSETLHGPRLAMEGTIGSGGMGIVRLATQTSIGRKVAVKSLRGGKGGEAAALAVLREAWLMGSLEHPNIMPVYDVALDAQGQPLIVLKRIEGEAWSTLLANDAAIEARFGMSALAWNLQTFLQVCHAIRFAHGRGIVHRDLKPENVMIGEFDEVYVLDWGISVSLRPDPSGRLPQAIDSHEMAGTPAYMAPEMMGGDGTQLGEHTDVYLLGAVLHEILSGEAPHPTDSLAALIDSATHRPSLPKGAPRGLAEICERAMAPAPEDRFANVAELAAAVQRSVQHAGSERLASRAHTCLEALEADARGEGAAERVDRLRLYSLLAQCRFGFREALDSWPDNDSAKQGIARALTTMIEFELEHGTPGACAALLAELDDPPPQLAKRIDEAVAAEAAELAALRHSAAQHDKTLGTRTRSFVTLLLGILWTTFPLVGYVWSSTAPDWAITAASAGFLFVAAGLGYWARESLSKTAVNRGFVGTIVAMMAIELVVSAVSWRVGMPLAYQHMMHVMLWLATCSAATVTVERRLAPACVGYGVALIVVALYPAQSLLAMAGANSLLTLVCLAAWRPETIFPSRRRQAS